MPEDKSILGGADDAAVVDSKIVDNDNAAPDNGNPQPEAFDYTKMIDEQGGLSENWRQALPEDIRGEKCLDSIKTIGTLAKSFVSAQKMVGANKITLPGENASAEEINAFHKALGRPDKAEDYSIEGVQLPEGIQLDDNQLKKFREFAFQQGISEKVFQEALRWDAQRIADAAQQRAAAADAEYDATLERLQQEWGGDFDDRIAQCNKALQTFGLKDVLGSKGLLNNYDIIVALQKIGGSISESRLKGGENTPASPQSQLDEILGNPDHAFYKKDHPAHDAAVRQVNELLAAKSRAKTRGNN